MVTSVKPQFGSLAVHDVITVTTVLTADDIGKVIEVFSEANEITVTLPTASSASSGLGKIIFLRNTGKKSVHVLVLNTDHFDGGPLALAPGESVSLMVQAEKVWSVLIQGWDVPGAIKTYLDDKGIIHKSIESLVKAGITTALGNDGDIAKLIDRVVTASADRKLIAVKSGSSSTPVIEFVLPSGVGDYEIEFSHATTDHPEGLYFVMQIAKENNAYIGDSYALSQLEDRSNPHKESPTAVPDAELHSANAAALTLQGELSNLPRTSISGRIRLVNPGNPTGYHHFLMDTIGTLKTGEHIRTEGGGVYFGADGAYTKVRLFYCLAGVKNGPQGNVLSGTFRLYHLKNSV